MDELHIVADKGPRSRFGSVEQAIADFAAGRAVVIVDSEDRENEGDVCMPAQLTDAAAVNFMAMHARGLICLSLTPQRCDELQLTPMAEQNDAPYATAFTVSIEARDGVTTGISAGDRARTIQVACDPSCGPESIVKPGHIFPLRARAGGVLERPGHTEASVDLARLAGLAPAGVICEIMNDDGTMARVPDLERFCAQHKLTMITVDALVGWRRRAMIFDRPKTQKWIRSSGGLLGEPGLQVGGPLVDTVLASELR